MIAVDWSSHNSVSMAIADPRKKVRINFYRNIKLNLFGKEQKNVGTANYKIR